MGRYLLLFCKIIVLILLQVWVFSPLYIFRLATPFPYIYILFLIPINVSKMGITLWSAFSGLLLDILSGTPGLHMAAFTATGFLRSYLLPLFVDSDTDGSCPPSLAVSGELLFCSLSLRHSIILFYSSWMLLGLSIYPISCCAWVLVLWQLMHLLLCACYCWDIDLVSVETSSIYSDETGES